MHDWPLLTMRGLDGSGDGALQVGVGEHDEGIAAPELEHDLLEVLARGGADLAAVPPRCPSR